MRTIEKTEEDNVAGFAKLAAAARESIERQRDDVILAFNERALHFQTAIDKISQGVCTFSPSAEIVVCNQAYLRMYALSPEIVKPRSPVNSFEKHERQVSTGLRTV